VEAAHLLLLELGADAQNLHLRLAGLGEAVDADDDPISGLDQPLVAVGRVLDLTLVEVLLDGGDGTAELLDGP
jgi:hypothetical protein